jgi:hypothetical protein
MKCPSDLRVPAAQNPDDGDPPVTGTFDKGNYGLNRGGGSAHENGNSGNRAGPEDAPSWTTAAYGQPSKNRGMAHYRDGGSGNTPRSGRIRDLTDGTSNCVVLGEMLTCGGGRSDDCRGCWGKAMGAAVSAYTGGNPEVDGPDGIATPNVLAVGIYADVTVHCNSATSSSCFGDPQLNCGQRTGDGLGGHAMRSRHVGGVHILLGDGAGRFISQNIDKLVYRALMTIQGNERTGEF